MYGNGDWVRIGEEIGMEWKAERGEDGDGSQMEEGTAVEGGAG